VEKYNKTIAGNSKVAMVHVSLERQEGLAEVWAAKEGFPWLTILPKNVKSSGLMDYKKTGFVPEYALIDKNGKQLASGGGEVFQKAVELTSDET
jgi:hypothetical protein